MADFQSYVEQSAAHVLANHELLMATPSASRLTSFYPTPSESQNTIAQAVCNSGQLTVQANSKNFGQSSDFIISSPNLMDVPHLQLSFDVPASVDAAAANLYAGSYHAGWGFDAIDQIEITFANSNISNLQIKGHAMRDWSLLQCKNESERRRVLDIAGKHQIFPRNVAIKMKAVVPLSFLFWRSAGGVKGGFPIDGRALNGPVIFRITFKTLKYFFGPCHSLFNPSQVPSYPNTKNATAQHGGTDSFGISSWTDCNLTFRTYQLMDGAFSVSKALEANPGFVYSIPSLWLNSYSQEVTLDASGFGRLNLNSAPAGMVQAMILRIRPVIDTISRKCIAATDVDNDNDSSDRQGGYNSRLNYEPYDNDNVETLGGEATGASEKLYRPYVPWSLPLDFLKLSYSGQAIYWARTSEEIDKFNSDIFQDDLKTDVCGLPLHLSVVQRTAGIPVTTNADPADQAPMVAVVPVVPVNAPESSAVMHQTQIIVIPLMHDGNDIFRKRGFENLPHYSGSTLQLEFQVKKYNTYKSDGFDRIANLPTGLETADDTIVGAKLDKTTSSCHEYPSNRTQKIAGNGGTAANRGDRSRVEINNDPTADGAVAFPGIGNSSAKVNVDITYVIPALFQVTNGTAELQL